MDHFETTRATFCLLLNLNPTATGGQERGVLVLKSWRKAILHQRVYRDVWVILTNTIMFFLAANLALGVLFLAKNKISSYGLKSRMGATWFDYTAYELDQAHADAVLKDFARFGQLGLTYQPWVQFSEPPYEGKLVNVD